MISLKKVELPPTVSIVQMASTEGPGTITVPSLTPEPTALFIFIHGLGDDASGWSNIASQFHSAGKLGYFSFVFPTAPFNHDALQHAWFSPTRLSPFPSSRPELDDPEDEEAMLKNLATIEQLIEDAVSKGMKAERVVVGGFSQGCAMTMLMGLVTKLGGKLGGLVGLSGFMPLVDRITGLREQRGLDEKVDADVPMFLARGTRDRLVPKRYWRLCAEKLREIGVKDEMVESHEYEGLGHAASGQELRDLCMWLERVVPETT